MASSSEPIVSIELPQILDSNPLDTFEVLIDPIKDFVEYDLANNILKIDTRNVQDDDLGVLELQIVLVDNKEASSKYVMTVNLLKEEVDTSMQTQSLDPF